MIKNVFNSGRMQIMYVPEDSDETEDDNLLEALQAQAERIELLEQQNSALLRQEQVLLKMLEVSFKTGRAITDSLQELRSLFAEKTAEPAEVSVGSTLPD